MKFTIGTYYKKHVYSWYSFILYYLLLKAVFGIDRIIVYGLIIAMLIVKTPFIYICAVFFSLAIFVYITGQDVEANYYFSFVYVFLFLSIFQNLYDMIRGKIEKRLRNHEG